MLPDLAEKGCDVCWRGALMTARRRALWLFASLLAPLALVGCNAGPDFAPPDPQLPAQSFGSGQGPAVAGTNIPGSPDPNWWRGFRDPILTELERRAAQANLDVRTATIRLAESRFQRGVAAAAQLPSINANGQYQRELYSANGIASLLNKLVPVASVQQGGVTIPPISDYTVGFDASWELDLWGHVRRQVESADAQADQSAELQRDALVSTQAELARDYIQLRGVQTQIRIANENLRISQDIQHLAEERQRKGVRTAFDTENATAQAESVRAQLPSLMTQETQYINAIGFLLDQPPGALRQEIGAPKATPLAPPNVPLGVPSELARRRPDIRAAEAQLHAATAQIGVAVAAFYPTVKLNGTVGLDALDLKNLWKGSSLQYNAGPSVSLPIFDAGRLKGTLEFRKAQEQEAAIGYHKTVLKAWHEVVDALVAYRQEQQRRARLKSQLAHSRQALLIARARYKDGVGDYLATLDAERTLLTAAQQYETSTENVSLDLVQLYKALGGGWEETFPDLPPVAEADAAPL
jgi:NodT family efflux transporter outer membrane factor (OMF) lipoprotein